MILYVVQRFGIGILTMLGATIITFILGVISPSDPAMVALMIDGNTVPTIGEIEEKRRELGLDAPYILQYLRWLGNILIGNWGISYITGDPVLPKLMNASKVTLVLTLLGTINVIVGGFVLGTILGFMKKGIVRNTILGLSLFGASVPSFWIAIVSMHLLSERWRLFPTNGYESLGHLLLPAFIMSISGTALLIRVHGGNVQKVLSSAYYNTARSKGLPSWYILYKHVLRNASLPSLTVVGNYLIAMIGGAIIVEVIFSIPGLGSLILESIRSRDYVLIQGYVLIMGAITAFVNIGIDMIYRLLQPRMT